MTPTRPSTTPQTLDSEHADLGRSPADAWLPDRSGRHAGGRSPRRWSRERRRCSAFEFVRSRPKPLGAYLFSSSLSVQRRFLAEVSAGGAVINHIGMHVLAPQLPFGGVGSSGMGGYHGRYGFEALSHRKSVLLKPQRPDLKLVYPPYTNAALKIMRKLF
ncbi:aldehyde dehydrogenase family protein [Nocardia fluminea]|uniref:aldehyde dehydrogenase family protein n=1 Tax=Nocardia fluminea TaxID=134984 RepID=UPI0037F970C4